MSRVKYWCFTLNNPTSDERDKILALDGDRQLEYLVFGNEVGDSGTPHLQGFVAFVARVRLTQLKQVISERAHFEAAFPRMEAIWLSTSAGDDQVLLLTREALTA